MNSRLRPLLLSAALALASACSTPTAPTPAPRAAAVTPIASPVLNPHAYAECFVAVYAATIAKGMTPSNIAAYHAGIARCAILYGGV